LKQLQLSNHFSEMEKFIRNITIHEIEQALSIDYDGTRAHRRFLPDGRSLEIPPALFFSVKESAVMVLLMSKGNELHLCLTRRNRNMKHHPGQISFPGGKIDKDEYYSAKAALREMKEEIGVDPSKISLCGTLSDLYLSVSNFLIHPIVGYLNHEPEFNLNHHEVEEMIIIRLEEFFNLKNDVRSTVETSLGQFPVPGYLIDGHFVWGATAMIISEFTERLKLFYCRRE
jgi:8-oxo-dGTP pyrophosphatase MutT (NUDIX family)